MLVRVAKLPQPAFDERFFLYYEDDDLCLRLLRSKQSMIIIPSCRIRHRSRGSVRSPRRLTAEYWRGYHHAQSKLIFINKHISPRTAVKQRAQLLAITTLALPVRAALWSPKLLARMLGRWVGLLAWNAR
jgi:GT2 family glycosyltransferase